MCSFVGSTTNTAPGSLGMSLMPPRFFSSLVARLLEPATSFLVSFSKVPSAFMRSSFLSLSMLFLMVEKLVSMPPSQRWLT